MVICKKCQKSGFIRIKNKKSVCEWCGGYESNYIAEHNFDVKFIDIDKFVDNIQRSI